MYRLVSSMVDLICVLVIGEVKLMLCSVWLFCMCRGGVLLVLVVICVFICVSGLVMWCIGWCDSDVLLIIIELKCCVVSMLVSRCMLVLVLL